MPSLASPSLAEPSLADAVAPRAEQFLSVSPRTGGGGRVVLDVVGEVDAFTAPLLWACLSTQLSRPGLREVVLDLGRLDFLSAAGIAVLADARRHCRERDVRLRLRSHGRRQVLRTLTFAGVIDGPLDDRGTSGGHRTAWTPSGRRHGVRRSGSDAAQPCR